MSPSRILLVIIGAIAALFGVALTAIGGVLLWAHATQRDDDGFFNSEDIRLVTDDHALATDDIDLGARPADWFPDRGELTFRISVTPATVDQAVFIGIAPDADVDAYLDDVAHERITRIGPLSRDVRYDSEPGATQPAPPGTLDIWAASKQGTGTTTLTWAAERGNWALVVMNADGDAGIAVTAEAGLRFELLGSFAAGLVVAGLVVGLAAMAMLIAGTRRTAKETDADGAVVPGSPAELAHARYPVVVTGHLDEGLSRWQPLVKWFLMIPHAIVLLFLWAAFALLTVVAGFAILFTGRYPHGIFVFNVGVMRWTWRVSYWSYGALGTDRYPPFSLASDPTYPADLDVAYPEKLSRGLVLVKWWLLAIPHYLIVGVMSTGLVAWAFDIGERGGATATAGMGLIGILVLIVAGALLFTGRYPAGLYDLVMGMQRWVYRVMAYASLMTDEYPPFRLDMGGSEQPVGPPPTSPAPEPTAVAHGHASDAGASMNADAR